MNIIFKKKLFKIKKVSSVDTRRKHANAWHSKRDGE